MVGVGAADLNREVGALSSERIQNPEDRKVGQLLRNARWAGRPTGTVEHYSTRDLLSDVEPALAEQSALPRKILAMRDDPPEEQ